MQSSVQIHNKPGMMQHNIRPQIKKLLGNASNRRRHRYHLRFFHWQGLFMKVVTSVVLVIFTWLFIYPTALAAKTLRSARSQPQLIASSDEAELTKTLAQIEVKLARLHKKLAQNQEASLEQKDLKKLRKRIRKLHTRVHKNFVRIEQHLKDKGLREEILQRHRKMVTTYDTELVTLLRNLEAIEAASHVPERRDKTDQALRHLKAKQRRRIPRSFKPNNLPFQVPDGTVRKPKTRTTDFHALLFPQQPVRIATAGPLPGLLAGTQAMTWSTTPSPDDLAPTQDVQITEKIKALAMSLGNNPVAIYNWVHDHIEFLPTYGSIQGAQMALVNKKGNAFDTASLLIALLRAANIPARYVIGTVQIPIEKVMNWVGGVHTPEAALQVLGQGGIPSTGLVQGGTITAVEMEHIWVDAWVDFVPSRGARHRTGDTWVPMDAAFKQYQYTEGMDLLGNISFDAQSFANQLTASAQSDEAVGWIAGIDHDFVHSTLAAYQDQVNAAIAAQKPDATLGEVIGTKTIIPARLSILAAGLPYHLVARGSALVQLPDHLRHKYRLTLYASVQDRAFDDPVWRFTASLPSLTGKKITFSFTPASQEDVELIVSYLPELPADGSPLDPSQLPTSLPGYLIRLKAELRLAGHVVASGGSFMLGQELVSTTGLYDPIRGWQDAEDNTPVAGDYGAIAIDAVGMTASQIQVLRDTLTATKDAVERGVFTGLSKEELLGDLLYSTVVSYFAATYAAAQIHAGTSGVVVYRRPSCGSFTVAAQVQYWFGVPRTVSTAGLEMDIDRLVSIVVSTDNHREAQLAYMQRSGVWMSAYEHLIPEQLFTDTTHPGEAVSAVKALARASAVGQQIYRLTQANQTETLSHIHHQPETMEEIRAALAAGKVVITHTDSITMSGWTGEGYLLLDPESGSSAYKIRGGANGSFISASLGTLVGYGSGLFIIAIAASLGPVGFVALLAAFSFFVTLMVLELGERSSPHSACFLIGFLAGLDLALIWGALLVEAFFQVITLMIMASVDTLGLFAFSPSAEQCH